MNVLKSYKFMFLFSALALMSLTAAGPCQDLGKKNSFSEVSASAFGIAEEAEFDRLLQAYVDKDSLVNYQGWLQNPQDFQVLKNTIEAMGKADDSTFSNDQKKAFYINAYNALTLDLILSNYAKTFGGNYLPKGKSIRNIENLDTNVWNKFKWLVAGKQRSLNDIENSILRPMGDARIHFAIVCASKGCPPLYSHTFTTGSLNSVLDQLAYAFVNSGKSTVIEKDKKIITTSQILNWFGQDFVKTFGSVQNFFMKYVQIIPSSGVANYRFQFGDYDWSLNESNIVTSPTPAPTPTVSPSPTPTPTPPPGSDTERDMSEVK